MYVCTRVTCSIRETCVCIYIIFYKNIQYLSCWWFSIDTKGDFCSVLSTDDRFFADSLHTFKVRNLFMLRESTWSISEIHWLGCRGETPSMTTIYIYGFIVYRFIAIFLCISGFYVRQINYYYYYYYYYYFVARDRWSRRSIDGHCRPWSCDSLVIDASNQPVIVRYRLRASCRGHRRVHRNAGVSNAYGTELGIIEINFYSNDLE